jgi:hypothetical protein
MMARSRMPTTLETFVRASSAVGSSQDSTGVTPLLTECRGPPHGMREVDRHQIVGDQPVEEHANAGEMLVDRGRLNARAQLLDILSNVHWLDLIKRRDDPVNPPQGTETPS